jgi:immune inhibitor A
MLSTGSRLARENVQQVDQLINFDDYDLNQDGHIDAMFMVHAGPDGADDGNVNHCWSHAISSFNYQTNDGVVIDGVTNVPEFAMVTPALETTMCCIAVMCHELGHLVGLPDLYDGTRNTWGIGYWGLMGYGAWGAGGNTPWSPSHMEAWSKVRAGFVDPVVITSDTFNLRILDIETNPIAYKVWRNGADCDTCFYLENRQQKGFDAPLPGPGLLIWHIDPSRGSWHNIVDLEEDSTFHLDHGNGTRPNPHYYHQELGDTSDPLPGNWNRIVFDNYSIPNSRDNRGLPTNVSVRNIRQDGDTIICDVTLQPVDIVATSQPMLVPKLIVGPNPFSTRVNLFFSPVPAIKSEPGVAAIYSSVGALVYKTSLPSSGRLSWSGTNRNGELLAAGVYLLRFAVGKQNFIKKLVIQR